MQAIVLEDCCEPEELRVSQVAMPAVRPGWMLVKVCAFGLNRSELMLRAYEARADYIQLPRIPGIECVGVVADPGNSRFAKGEKVCALMGGMGRSFDGSYAEYALLPEKNVFSIEAPTGQQNASQLISDQDNSKATGLQDINRGNSATARTVPGDTKSKGITTQQSTTHRTKEWDRDEWAAAAAVPETWYTAWGSLFECLQLRAGESLLIRGGTSALGLAALQIAHALGCYVATTTRQEARLEQLRELGADAALHDAGGTSIEKAARAVRPNGFDAVLDLLGVATLPESMRLAARPGRVCMTGLLGSHEPWHWFDPIKDIPNGVSLSGFHSNWPTQQTMSDIFTFIAKHNLQPLVGKRYDGLASLGRAHADMEASRNFGKAVVVL